MRSQVFSTLLLLAWLLVACGGSGDNPAEGVAEGDRPQSFDDLEFRSPIGEFLGIDFGASDEMEAQFAEMDREAGRLTAECMRNLGFEYVPPDNQAFASFDGPGSDLPYFSDEWVEKYGFGITTQRFPQSAVGDLVGYPDEQLDGLGDDYVDPNDDYRESLSVAEQEAYDEALYGQAPDFGPEGPDEDFEFEPTGCQNEAFEQAFNDGPIGNQDDFYQAFGDQLEALQLRAEADPRIVEFNDAVAACVAEAGMEWSGQEELYSRFEGRLENVQPAAFQGDVDPFAEAGLDPEQMSERELNDFFQDLNRLDADGLAVLAELQAEEIALAKVVIGCGGGPLNEQVIMGEIRVEYEQDFLDANAAALDEFKAD